MIVTPKCYFTGLGSLGKANMFRFKRCPSWKKTMEGRRGSYRIRINSEDVIRRIDNYSGIHGVYIVQINSP